MAVVRDSLLQSGRRIMLGGLAACVLLAAPARAGESTPPAAMEALTSALATGMDPRVAEVLPGIAGAGARLLALRSYLRSGDRLAERWSWTPEQIAAFEGSPEQRELHAEIERVRQRFEQLNPGYGLFVNPQVRSLDLQLASWNRNDTVAAASARLLQDALAHLAGDAGGDQATRAAKLAEFLRAYTPEPIPTVAAPGLSPHGQMRAVDFQVHRGMEIVAGPDSRTLDSTWLRGGWAGRLDEAVRAASRRFIGPLASPREPWHYTYTAVAVADQ